MVLLDHLFLKVNFLESEGLFIIAAGSSARILEFFADDGLLSWDAGFWSPFPILDVAAAFFAVGDLALWILSLKSDLGE